MQWTENYKHYKHRIKSKSTENYFVKDIVNIYIHTVYKKEHIIRAKIKNTLLTWNFIFKTIKAAKH